MSVIIQGMEMPKTCDECCLESFCDKWIDAIKMSGSELKVGAKTTIRHPDCPLVEVRPHSRLIEASALGMTDFEIIMCDGDYKEALKMLLRKIETAPTIIPTEEANE